MKSALNLKLEYLIFPGFLLITILSALHLLTPSAEFTGDDYYYIANNPLVTTSGFSSLFEIWLRAMKVEFFPVTITSYALEYRLWGGRVALYHLTNLVIFASAGFAAFSFAKAVLLRYYGGINSSGKITLAVFAATTLLLLHPLNVESAASISNRKELLYVLFGFISLNFYISGKGLSRYTGVLLFMVLAQLSKGTAVILPTLYWVCELLLITGPKERKRLILPFFASIIAALLFMVQFRVAYRAGVIEKSLDIDLLSRAGGILRSLNMMFIKFIFPVNLSYDYDFVWPQGLPGISECLLPLTVAVAFLYLCYKKSGWLSALLSMILLTLLPYSNLVPLHHNSSGQMVFYDHYLLFAIMLSAPLLAIVIIKFEKISRHITMSVVLLLIIGLPVYNYHLFSYWKDRITLYSRIIDVTPTLPKGYLFLGKTFIEKERYKEAIEILNRMIALDNWFPTYMEAYRELGNAYAFSGQMAEAEKSFRKHLEYQPKDRITLQNLSSVLIELRKFDDAKAVILAWMMHYPDDSAARYNLQLCEKALDGN